MTMLPAAMSFAMSEHQHVPEDHYAHCELVSIDSKPSDMVARYESIELSPIKTPREGRSQALRCLQHHT